MHRTFLRNRVFRSGSGNNRKSKTCAELGRSIQNLQPGADPPQAEKWLVLAVIVFVLVVPGAVAQAQQPKKVPRVGYLTHDPLSVDLPRRDGFRQGLRELGYTEGRNIVIEYRTYEGKAESLPELAAEIARLKVDVIFAFGSLAVQAARKEMPTVPMVSITPDPVAAGLVASLARPGGNITGLSTTAGKEIYGKYLELLTETIPKLTRVAFLSNPTSPFNPLALEETQSAARALKMSLQLLEARTPEELETAFAAATKERAGAILVSLDAMFLAQRARMAELAAKSRLPAMYGILEHADAGGLMAYAANRPDIFRRAATYVDKILKGAKPADIPVEQPMKFEVVINLKTAKQIGVTIPPNVLVRADRVIK
jgi:putative ABC transport system substrate-binding protein